MNDLRVLDRKLENNIFVGQRLVNLGECVKLGLHVDKVLRVQKDLQHLGAINLVSNALANNFSGVNNILQNKIRLVSK